MPTFHIGFGVGPLERTVVVDYCTRRPAPNQRWNVRFQAIPVVPNPIKGPLFA